MKNYNLLEKELRERFSVFIAAYKELDKDIGYAGMLDSMLTSFTKKHDELGSWWYREKASDIRDEAILEIEDYNNEQAYLEAMAETDNLLTDYERCEDDEMDYTGEKFVDQLL